MVYKIKYTMFDERNIVEYVRTWSGMQKVLREVLRHKGDNANVERVEVFKIDHVPILKEPVDEEFVQGLWFAEK